MAVSEILSQKGRNVVTVKRNATIKQVADLLASEKIGAIVVTSAESTVEGIVSERDVVRVVARDGADALDAVVSTCMTSKVVTCDEAEDINSLMEKMTAGKFRHIPVVKNGQLSGIISIGDVVKRKIEMAEREAEEMKRYIAG